MDFNPRQASLKVAYLNCLKFTGCLDFQNCISKNSFMKSVDEKNIFINIYDLCKNQTMNYLYFCTPIKICNMDIYRTPNFTTAFK